MIGRSQYTVLYKEENSRIEVTISCVFCGETQPTLNVGQRSWESYSSGALPVQEAFPSLTADERELLISATCSKCWDDM